MELASRRIKDKKTEDYIRKCNVRPFCESIINIAIAETTENVPNILLTQKLKYSYGVDWQENVSVQKESP